MAICALQVGVDISQIAMFKVIHISAPNLTLDDYFIRTETKGVHV